MNTQRLLPLTLAAGLLLAGLSPGQVSFDEILHASGAPQNWLTYGGGYASQRYSLLTGLTRNNVQNLELKWIYHPKYLDKMEATPIVVNGVLYTGLFYVSTWDNYSGLSGKGDPGKWVENQRYEG